jgi:hypothetical protein
MNGLAGRTIPTATRMVPPSCATTMKRRPLHSIASGAAISTCPHRWRATKCPSPTRTSGGTARMSFDRGKVLGTSLLWAPSCGGSRAGSGTGTAMSNRCVYGCPPAQPNRVATSGEVYSHVRHFKQQVRKFHRSCLKLFSVAAPGQGRRHDHETTVDHALIRGLVTAGPAMRRGASSV